MENTDVIFLNIFPLLHGDDVAKTRNIRQNDVILVQIQSFI